MLYAIFNLGFGSLSLRQFVWPLNDQSRFLLRTDIKLFQISVSSGEPFRSLALVLFGDERREIGGKNNNNHYHIKTGHFKY